MKFDVNKDKYQYLISYFQENGDINVPLSYEVNINGKNIKLGSFVNSLRKKYRQGKMTSEEIEFLKNLNISWTPLEDNWNFMYERLRKYKDTSGNLEVKTNYVEIVNDERVHLGRWLNMQRKNYLNALGIGKGTHCNWCLSKERIKLLEDLGFDWRSIKIQNWFKRYAIALNFFQKNGNLDVPLNIYYECGNEKFKLYDWLAYNKNKYLYEKDSLTDDQIDALKKINITKFGSFAQNNWLFMYNEAVKYYNEHYDLRVPARYSYYDSNGTLINLGNWINVQRKRYKNTINPNNGNKPNYKLSDEEIKLLNKIGMLWKINFTFSEVYPYLLAYYNHYGNLDVPVNFKTDDGYTLKNDGQINLYRVANKFKALKIIDSDKALLLARLNYKWSVKVNTDTIIKLCEEKQIDVFLNEKVIARTSYIEFASKVNYLEINNIPFTENGYLHPIFMMSNAAILEEYQISLEDIIDKYYKKRLEKNRLLTPTNP